MAAAIFIVGAFALVMYAAWEPDSVIEWDRFWYGFSFYVAIFVEAVLVVVLLIVITVDLFRRDKGEHG